MKRWFVAAACAALAVTVFAVWPITSGCDTALSEDVTITLSGRVLLADGSPAKGLTVKLLKTDLDTLGVDWVVGVLVNEDAKAFLETTTDDNGNYNFSFSGKEANSKNGYWAAYFVAYVTDGTVDDSPGMVATDSFTFSDQEPSREMPDMRFLTLPTDAVSIGQAKGTFTVKWEATDLAPEGGRYIINLANSSWVAETKETTYTLPLSSLAPCTNLKQGGGCQEALFEAVRVFSLADGLRYRSNWAPVAATNPKGIGFVPQVPEGETYFKTCSGQPLKMFIDGVYHPVSSLDWGNNLQVSDLSCVEFDLGSAKALTEIYVHAGSIWNHGDSTVTLSATDKDAPTAADYQVLGTYQGSERRFWYFDQRLDASTKPIRFFRMQVENAENSTMWAGLGEVSFYEN